MYYCIVELANAKYGKNRMYQSCEQFFSEKDDLSSDVPTDSANCQATPLMKYRSGYVLSKRSVPFICFNLKHDQ